MRLVLSAHLRARAALKRGALEEPVPIEDIQVAEAGPRTGSDLLALNEALERLGSLSPRLRQLIEYRFFGGLTHEEIAEVMGLSVRTVKRDWTRARVAVRDDPPGGCRRRERAGALPGAVRLDVECVRCRISLRLGGS